MREPLRVVFIDNFDSFTFNLVDEFARRGCLVETWRNDVTPAHVLARATSAGPALIVLSPGPGAPADAGCCLDLVRLAAGRVPLLGVCLGHQAIIEAFGGRVGPADEVLHGRTSRIRHAGDPLFAGVPSPCTVGRYHSLVGTTVADPIVEVAWAGDVAMAVRHRALPVLGVQFHPESILTPDGGRLIENVIAWALAEGRDAHR